MEATDDDVWERRREEFVLSSKQLPKVETWNEFGLCNYQGFWFPSVLLPNVMCFQEHFIAHDDDIILSSFPKTGTTWLKSLVFSILNRAYRGGPVDGEPKNQNKKIEDLNSIDHVTMVTTPLLTSNPHTLIPFFEFQVYGGGTPNKEYLTGGGGEGWSWLSRLFSTHISYTSLADTIKSSKCKIVYIVRNPLDVVVSFWHFSQIFPWSSSNWTIDEFMARFCSGESDFGPFTDHVLEYWKASLKRPEKVLFLKYEDLKADTVTQVKGLAEFLGFPFNKEEESRGVIDEIIKLCSFGNLKGLEVNQPGNYFMPNYENNAYFRKGQVGDWANHLSPSMAEHVHKVIEEKLHGSGLTFELKM